MNHCKYCGCKQLVKNGFVAGKQRYRCKDCLKSIRDGDKRKKYNFEKQLKVLKLYLEGAGIRSISRMEGVSAPLIIDWVKNYDEIIRENLISAEIPGSIKDIQMLGLDELFTHYQKKDKESMHGLLWTESGIKLLISK